MKGKNFLDHFEERLGAALFVAVFAILVAQIVSRQIFDSPLIWSEELAKLLFVYVGMLGVSIGVKGDQHVMIDFFYEKLSPRVRKFVFTGIQLLILISIIALIVLGYKLFMRKIRFE
ncbi:MAG: TRAP transporter small permease, partial [Cetobacterium sp.]